MLCTPFTSNTTQNTTSYGFMVNAEHLGNIIPNAVKQEVTAAEHSDYLVCATFGAIQRGVQLCFTGCVSFHQAPEPSTHQMLQSQSKGGAVITFGDASHHYGIYFKAQAVFLK